MTIARRTFLQVAAGAATLPAMQGLDMPPANQRTPEALAVFHKSEIDKRWPILRAAGIKAQ